MSRQEFGTYQRFYCESCHQLRDGYGLMSTLTVSYDMTFNLIVLSAVCRNSVEFEPTRPSVRCVFNHAKADSDLFRMMAGYTLILAKWELYDDLVDKPTVRSRFADLSLSRAVSKAVGLYPDADSKVGEGFARLRELETEGCCDPVFIGREFGKFITEPMMSAVKEEDRPDLMAFFADLTSAIYLIDEIDDLDSDYMDGTFNALLEGKRDTYVNKQEFLRGGTYGIARMMKECFADLQDSYEKIRDRIGGLAPVTDNIIYFGLPESAKHAMDGSGQNTFELGSPWECNGIHCLGGGRPSPKGRSGDTPRNPPPDGRRGCMYIPRNAPGHGCSSNSIPDGIWNTRIWERSPSFRVCRPNRHRRGRSGGRRRIYRTFRQASVPAIRQSR